MIQLAGNATDDRKRAENLFKAALKDDPKKKSEATRTLEANYNAARTTELNQTGQNEQARGPFG